MPLSRMNWRMTSPICSVFLLLISIVYVAAFNIENLVAPLRAFEYLVQVLAVGVSDEDLAERVS